MKNQYLWPLKAGYFAICRCVCRWACATWRLSAASLRPSAPGGVSGPLRSAGVLTFGPNNVLFVGDITGAKIHAFALRDKDLTSQTDVISGNFHNFEGRDHVAGLDQKLAALFGTTIDKIVINDMAVHQPTRADLPFG